MKTEAGADCRTLGSPSLGSKDTGGRGPDEPVAGAASVGDHLEEAMGMSDAQLTAGSPGDWPAGLVPPLDWMKLSAFNRHVLLRARSERLPSPRGDAAERVERRSTASAGSATWLGTGTSHVNIMIPGHHRSGHVASCGSRAIAPTRSR